MRRLVVTGGAGFIGSHFIREILKRRTDVAVLNVDKLSYSGNRANIGDFEHHPRHRFLKADICNRSLMDRVCRGVWGVVNFAAETHVDRSIHDVRPFLRTNVLGIEALLHAARGARVKRFLQISTDEVYGSVTHGRAREDAPLLPNNPYAASKAAGDGLVRAYGVTYGMPVVIARSTNNFGPYQYPEKIIPLFITNLLAGRRVPLYGRGQHGRDWIYVIDNVRALDLILDKGKPGEVYNVGGGRAISNLLLTRTLLGILGRPARFISYVADRPGHDLRYCLDVRKLRGLGFRRSHDFKSALRETAQWYAAHAAWWRRLKNNRYTAK